MAVVDIFFHWITVAGATAVYIVMLYTYRLFLHPLANFPGPKFAAMTLWYEFYFDAIKRGQYIFRIKEMHDQYGPVVRISPDELHVIDPDFIPVLMTTTRKTEKHPRVLQLFGFSEAAITTKDHDVHRSRRAAMARMFSKDSIRRLEPLMQDCLDKLFNRLQELRGSGKPISVLPMFAAFTSDLIVEYSFGISRNWLDAPEFNKGFFEMFTAVHLVGPWAVQFSWIMPLFNALPASFLRRTSPGMAEFLQFKSDLMAKINRLVGQRHQDGNTVLDEILRSNLIEYEKRPERLLEEAQTLAAAGTETTAWTLTAITFYLLDNPTALEKLKAELTEGIPDLKDPLSFTKMEQLPYLGAVILEGLRLGMGTSNRQMRVCPNDSIIFNDGNNTKWHIPPGTPVGMTTPLVHLNPSIFPDPLLFKPDRFLENPRLKRYILSFSHGSRQCLGINLAYAEMYLVLSSFWRRFDGPASEKRSESGRIKLYQTDKTDVEMQHDLFVPYAKRGSQGVKIIIEK